VFGVHANRGAIQKQLLSWLEKWVVGTCNVLILNTPGAERLYRMEYPADAHKMTCIPNGFDRLNLPVAPPHPERFTIMHVGDFYRSRTPARLLEALASLKNSDIEFVHVGPWCAALEAYKDRVRIRHIDHVVHAEALALMQTASLLYLAGMGEDGVTECRLRRTYEH
jgi:glycosyltransferase involved in cell wall biosynthesis